MDPDPEHCCQPSIVFCPYACRSIKAMLFRLKEKQEAQVLKSLKLLTYFSVLCCVVFLGLLDPDPLVRDTDPAPAPTIIKQSSKKNLKREHPVLKNMKILDFFLFLWVIFALLDPDPATQINADPDPKPWQGLIKSGESGKSGKIFIPRTFNTVPYLYFC